jgi:type IV pilus assembly protein PilX
MSRPATARPSVALARGASLLFALITVAGLSLASVALIRSVDTGTGILGNLGFKQDSLLASDEATRQALTWLGNNIAGATLHNNVVAQGYVAQHLPLLDPTGSRSDATRTLIDWADKPCSSYATGSFAACLSPLTLPALPNGVKAQYVILRLCSGPGDASSVSLVCSKPLTASASVTGERGEISAQNTGRVASNVLVQYFRVIVRTQGARQTVSTTETLVHL